jgi:hypothetical protein
MQKYALILIFIQLFCTSSFSQLRINAGYNASSIRLSSEVYSGFMSRMNEEIRPLSGFHVGATYEIPLSKVFSVEPGLIFSSKGYRVFPWEASLYSERKTTLYYLDVPTHLKAKVNIGKARLFVGFGPYVSLGLFSNMNIDGVRFDIDFADLGFKRFDSGLSFITGLEFGKIQVGAFYQLGLVNLNQHNVLRRTNRVFGLSLSYRLGK